MKQALSPGAALGRFSRLAAVGKTIGSWLIGVAFVALVIFAIATGGKAAALVQPYVDIFSTAILAVVLPVSLLLLLFRRSRGYGGLGLYFASFPPGLTLWVTCFAYALSVSVFWTVAGILLGGLGVVPIAAIMTLIRKDWSSFGTIIGTAVGVFVLRGLGAWIVEKADEWRIAAEGRAETARENFDKRGNYLVRHWRGQLSLGVSYWINGFLATFIVGVAAAIAAGMQADLRTHAVFSLGVFALAIIASIWQGVGVWRSASNHFSRGGTHFWAGVAKVMVVLGFLSTVGIILRSYVPQSAEMLRIIAGDTGIPAYQIQVLPGGSEIEFRGGLRAGSAKELERILAAVPRAKVLHIESPGGRIFEAEQMMQLVRQRNLTTYTSEYCLSAATLVLMAGKERVIEANAKVGFHAGSFPGLTAEQQRESDVLLQSIMHSAGVSQQFVDRVLRTPPDQMWYPSFEEMRLAGVITSQSFGERFAVPWAQSDEEIDKMVEEIGEQPWFRTMRQLEPTVYGHMINEFTTAIKSGKSEGEAIASVRATAATLMETYFPAASDEALLALLQNEWIAILSRYGNSNSRACIAALGGSPDSTIDFARAFPGWDASKELELADLVMRTGASKVARPVNQAAAGEDLQRIFKSLAATYGNDLQLLDKQNEWMNNSAKVCDILLAMYQQIAALSPNRAANIVRYLVTTKSPNAFDQFDAVGAVNQSPAITPTGITYHVVKLRPGDNLNLRAGPGSNYPIVWKLPAGTRGISLRRGRIANGTAMWQEISAAGYSGWVNETYLEADQH
ncbi:MAG TPA: SH3 domain-containing protein [Chthoniobacterales bacterium]|nr:SH3 domain-containing protein [Chthoniobacterales bacterium]